MARKVPLKINQTNYTLHGMKCYITNCESPLQYNNKNPYNSNLSYFFTNIKTKAAVIISFLNYEFLRATKVE